MNLQCIVIRIKGKSVYLCCSQQPIQPVIPTVKEPPTAPIGTKDIDIKHKVLLLGSGLVTGPVVDYLMRDQSICLTIGKQAFIRFNFYQHTLSIHHFNNRKTLYSCLASVDENEAAALSEAYANASSVSIDVQHERDRLNKLVGDHELVIR